MASIRDRKGVSGSFTAFLQRQRQLKNNVKAAGKNEKRGFFSPFFHVASKPLFSGRKQEWIPASSAFLNNTCQLAGMPFLLVHIHTPQDLDPLRLG